MLINEINESVVVYNEETGKLEGRKQNWKKEFSSYTFAHFFEF